MSEKPAPIETKPVEKEKKVKKPRTVASKGANDGPFDVIKPKDIEKWTDKKAAGLDTEAADSETAGGSGGETTPDQPLHLRGFIDAHEARQRAETVARVDDIASKIVAAREALERSLQGLRKETADEVRGAEQNEKRSNLEEAIDFLRTAGHDAQKAGDGESVKKYAQAIRALRKKVEPLQTNNEGPQRQLGGAVEEKEEKFPLDVEEQMEDDGVVDLTNAKDTAEYKKIVEERDKLRRELVKELRKNFLAKKEKNKQTENGQDGEEASSEAANSSDTPEKKLGKAESMAKILSSIKGNTDEDLGKLQNAVRNEIKRREHELDGGPQPLNVTSDRLAETLTGIPDDVLKNIDEGVAREIEERNARAQELKGVEHMSPEEWKAEREAADGVKGNITPPEETTPEQWEAYYKEGLAAKKRAEDFGYSVETKKLTEAIKEAAGDRGAEITNNTPPEHKNFILALHEKYRALPFWGKALITSALLGGAYAATVVGGPVGGLLGGMFWLTSRSLSGLSVYANVDSATKNWKSRFWARAVSGGAGVLGAIMLPKIFTWADQYLHVGDTLREWIGLGKTGAPGAPKATDTGVTGGAEDSRVGPKGDRLVPKSKVIDINGLTVTAPVNPAVFAEHLFDGPIQVTEADRARGLWGILERKLADAHLLDASTSPQRKNFMIATLEKRLEGLGPDGLKKIGFGSGNIDIIRTGERLNLSVLKETMYRLR